MLPIKHATVSFYSRMHMFIRISLCGLNLRGSSSANNAAILLLYVVNIRDGTTQCENKIVTLKLGGHLLTYL